MVITSMMGGPLNRYFISYGKVGKPTSTRKLALSCEKTFEEIIYEPMLNILSNSVYKTDYWYEMEGRYVLFERIRGAGNSCTYRVKLNSLNEKLELLAEYEVDIECLENNTGINLFVEEEKSDYWSNWKPRPKLKKLAKWARAERIGIRNFLILLSMEKDIEKLKKFLSRATFFRNKKICEEKGYIKDGKLVRKVMV